MGWKSVKEHYRIEHAVAVYPEKGICIGSPYIHDVIVIGFDGVIKKRLDRTHNVDLNRYQSEFDADPELLKRLILQEDKFEKSLPVWTYSGSRIVEKFCEEYGWPNVTHDGLMMYDNTFSKDRAVIVREAYQNAKAGHELTGDRVEQTRKELEEIESRNSEYFRDMCRLVELARSESIDLKEDDYEGESDQGRALAGRLWAMRFIQQYGDCDNGNGVSESGQGEASQGTGDNDGIGKGDDAGAHSCGSRAD